MSQDQINDREWNNPQNWSLLSYRSRLDSRIFVPKRRGMGVTINCGHKSATLYMVVFVALILTPCLIATIAVVMGK